MSGLYSVIGRNDPMYLLADPHGADKITIPMEPGNGTVARGTVMFRAANGMYKPATAADVVDTKYLAVLNEVVDTEENATVAENGDAFRAGRLLAPKVLLTDGTKVTRDQALILRKQGIVLEQFDDWTEPLPEFDNTK